METIRVDVAVVGGGIAGVSLAAELAATHTVAVLEQEWQLAYHASGRSAAAFLESYGSPEIRALTRAARPVFTGAGSHGQGGALLTPRPLVWVARHDQVAHLDELMAGNTALRRVEPAVAVRSCPALRPDWVAGAAVEAGAQDLDVHGLFEHYRRRAVAHGVRMLTGAQVTGGGPGDGWRLVTGAGEVHAAQVVNAGGAWVDEIAARLGVAGLGMVPMRRTVAVATGAVERSWPLVADVAEGFYFRPEGDGLLISPADETPSPPCDARAETEAVALALERINEATTLDLRHVRTSWAGLRTFSPDRNPVAGEDPEHPGFFWLAGQGGYGMQTAPAMAWLAAAQVRGEAVPPALVAEGLSAERLSPARLRQGSRAG